ncbi:hypothetical protein MHYP_G00352050 [Metynnis hypsauchen]
MSREWTSEQMWLGSSLRFADQRPPPDHGEAGSTELHSPTKRRKLPDNHDQFQRLTDSYVSCSEAEEGVKTEETIFYCTSVELNTVTGDGRVTVDGGAVLEGWREQSLEQPSVVMTIITPPLHSRGQHDSIESEERLFDSTAGTSDVSDTTGVLDRASKVETTAWRSFYEEDKGPEKLDFRPQRTPGVYLQTKIYTPLELFKVFFSLNLVKNIVENTNQKDNLSRWQLFDKPLNLREFYRFLGLLLYMWYVKAPTISDYWSNHQLYRFKLPSDVMTKSRFEAIQQRLQISDPQKAKTNKSKMGKRGYDPLYEIRPLLVDVAEACKTRFHPDRNLTISERVFIDVGKSDPKVGIKVLAMSDSSTGYIWNISVYKGAIDSSSREMPDFEFLRQLVNPVLLGRGYHVYVKNVYTPPDMFKRFKSSCHSSMCGPVRLDANSFPCTRVDDFPEDAQRGSVCWIRQQDLLFLKWMNTEEVVLCSTMHKVQSDEDSADQEHESKPSLTPSVIRDYSKYARTLDLFDSMCSYHWELQKGMTWDKAFFYYALDVAFNNSFLLNQEMKLPRKGKSLSKNEFIEGLIIQLLSYGKFSFRAEQATEQMEKDGHPQTSQQKKSDAAKVKDKVPPPPRAPQACMPVFFDANMKSLCVKCKLCETNTRCKGCSVALCLTAERNCFQDWHVCKGVAKPIEAVQL